MTDSLSPALPSATPKRAIHPLFHAGRWILADLLSTFLFVGFYALTHSVLAATFLSIAAGLIQLAWSRLRRQRIDTMQWLSLCLVIVFGSAALITRDPRFVMLKPTLIYAAIGVVMLKPGWMTRYMPEVASTWGADVAVIFGYVWALLMFATAGANLVLVARGDPRTWALFLGAFPIGSKIVLVAVQYLTSRRIIRRRMHARRAAELIPAPD